MLTRSARAHSSSCLQVISVYVHPFCLNSPLCSLKVQKFTKTPYFGVEGCSRVTDVNSTKKHVISACYDKQHFCAYRRFHARQVNSAKSEPVEGPPIHPSRGRPHVCSRASC